MQIYNVLKKQYAGKIHCLKTIPDVLTGVRTARSYTESVEKCGELNGSFVLPSREFDTRV